jgi:hypothetical protein
VNLEGINAVSTEVLEKCKVDGGKLTLSDADFAAFGARIQSSDDKKGWGTAMIALANRLRGVPGAGPAAERVLALAAVALGDAELNRALASAAKSKKS